MTVPLHMWSLLSRMSSPFSILLLIYLVNFYLLFKNDSWEDSSVTTPHPLVLCSTIQIRGFQAALKADLSFLLDCKLPKRWCVFDPCVFRLYPWICTLLFLKLHTWYEAIKHAGVHWSTWHSNAGRSSSEPERIGTKVTFGT